MFDSPKEIAEQFARDGYISPIRVMTEARAAECRALLEQADYNPLQPLVDWLDYNGYSVITKPAKEFTDEQGRRRIKGDMDIEIAIDMVEAAEHLEHIILFSGDGDFCRAIKAAQAKGARVSVVSTLRSKPPMIADELRRAADSFIELLDLDQMIGREA